MIPEKYSNCLPYVTFLEECKTKVYPDNTKFENHHIVPQYDGGTNDPDNMIRISDIDHWNMHKILFDHFDDGRDATACSMIQARIASVMGMTEEMRKEMSAARSIRMKKYWSDPANRAKIGAALSDPASRAKISAAAKERCKDPAVRAKMSAVREEHLKDPAVRAKISVAAKKRYEDPEYRAKMGAKIKAGHARSKALKAAAKLEAQQFPTSDSSLTKFFPLSTKG